ncbi:hypothetical protein [Neorhizobium galegae]|uniref:hypothetical protein n=1 Tax=Neorhizobium galegae TaxID=399 RepID=UPI00203586B5|nr:hypothetical protein [Neorhizobium galegae]MCM2500081.1 hypothetical protein [Neorhizobium galegae]
MTRLRKSGIQVAQEHVDALIDFLEAHEGEPLPRFGLELNRTAIARECGFDRQVFRTNPRCRALIEEADTKDREQHHDRLSQAEFERERKGKSEKDRNALEDRILKLAVENRALKQELQRFRQLQEVLLRTGRIPTAQPTALGEMAAGAATPPLPRGMDSGSQ